MKKGSQAVAVAEETPSIPVHIRKKRTSLLGEGSLKDLGNVFQFTRDVHFPSLSQAAGVVAGGKADGLKMWKKGEGGARRQSRWIVLTGSAGSHTPSNAALPCDET